MSDRKEKTIVTEEDILHELDRESLGSETADDFEVDYIEDSDDSFADSDFEPEEEDFDREEELTDTLRSSAQDHADSSQPTPSTSKRSNSAAFRSKESKTQKTMKRKADGEDEDNGRGGKILKLDSEKVLGRNATFEWKTKPICDSSRKFAAKNIGYLKRRANNDALDVCVPVDCFLLYFTPEIMHTVLIHTNAEIALQRMKYKNSSSSTLKDTSIEELKALIGIIILAGVKRDNHMTIKTLHDPVQCGEKYRAAFSKDRHNFLLNCQRFDSRLSRADRQENDRLAPVREIWDLLIKRCKALYEPSPYMTIDEQLVPFRGRAIFKMYIPNKQSKYGIKIVMICDHGSHYMYDAIPYLGKGTTPKDLPVAEFFVEQLTNTIKHTNRNITMDNWFSSISVAQQLKNNGLTMVGTIRKNKPELPQAFIDPKYQNRSAGSSLFLFHEDVTAVSYAPAKNKLVTLISTMHDDDAVNCMSSKPEIIMCYNETKGSVDSFDQCISLTSCIRRTKRWPMNFFYNMLNIATFNSFVIYSLNFFKRNPNNMKLMTRYDYLVELADQLMFPWMQMRLENYNLPGTIKVSFRKCLGIEMPKEITEQPRETSNKRKYCTYCDIKKKRLSKMICENCKKPVCGTHSCIVCHPCNEEAKKES